MYIDELVLSQRRSIYEINFVQNYRCNVKTRALFFNITKVDMFFKKPNRPSVETDTSKNKTRRKKQKSNRNQESVVDNSIAEDLVVNLDVVDKNHQCENGGQ